MDNFFVKMWKEDVEIPTYETGSPEKNPMFFEKRVYQGSSGKVYPNPIIEKIHDEKVSKTYQAIFLENSYIKIMVLPQFGGRIQMAYDKIGNRHFIYYNEVIKPALVGLCGPWISGGIEFNWPQHHRPSTYEPVDFALEENKDGSKTIWVNEIERMNHTKGMAGYTLYPNKAYIEIKVKLFNRTSLPQSFLWWANPAVAVNDQYQSVFPPDVHAVFDHGRRDVSDFPIAKGVYYKVDYAPGTDISRYSNIPVPTSYMAVNSNYDFVGGYEHDSHGGLLHVANHHLSPGKKQWTWGNGDFGKAWDRNLTDHNGPYVELMTGIFTDNQPDFSWIMPYEEKEFSQYFLPYRELGKVMQASKDILLHFSVENQKALLKLFATSEMKHIQITIKCRQIKLETRITTLSPNHCFNYDFNLAEQMLESDFEITVRNECSEQLLQYRPSSAIKSSLPEPARAPFKPEQTRSNEQLYLTGLHLEQYRHATYDPVNYYLEALRRDDSDSRCNNALGLLLMRQAQFVKSEPYFRKAIETLTRFNPNPYDGEPYFNLGLCLKAQHRPDEAYAAFYKSAWNSAWQSNSFFELSRIDMARGDYEVALNHLVQSIHRNAGNNKARVLKISVLRKLNRIAEALEFANETLRNDVFNLAVYYEKYKLHDLLGETEFAKLALQNAYELGRGEGFNFIEYAIDYAAAGLFDEAEEWLQVVLKKDTKALFPLILYYLGWISLKQGKHPSYKNYFEEALACPEDIYFPNRCEDIEVLQTALKINSKDYRAAFYLGCIWFDKRQYQEAINFWEICVSINSKFAPAYRVLAIAYFNKAGDRKKALQYFENAFYLNPKDARVLMEFDQLMKRFNYPPQQRLKLLEHHLPQVNSRDDLYLERIAIYNYLGSYHKAYDLLMQHKFHPWEGGEGRVSGQYKCALIQMAILQITVMNYEEALSLLGKARVFPENLGEGKLYGSPENDILYWTGCVYEGLGEKEKAAAYFEKATAGVSKPCAAIFYNDPQPDSIFYQGLSWEKLGYSERANEIFGSLLNYGETHITDTICLDFFAVSLPDLLVFDDDLDKRNQIHCQYMMGLGYLGLREYEKAAMLFSDVEKSDAMHLGAHLHAQLIPVGS